MKKCRYCQLLLHSLAIFLKNFKVLGFFLRSWRIFKKWHCFLTLFPWLRRKANRYKQGSNIYDGPLWDLCWTIITGLQLINRNPFSVKVYSSRGEKRWMNQSAETHLLGEVGHRKRGMNESFFRSSKVPFSGVYLQPVC